MWENDDVANFAEMILSTFVRNVCKSKSLQTILSAVDVLLNSTEWQYLRTGLCILEACLLFSSRDFAVHVPVALEAALNFCSHQCVRVQHQAIQLLGSLCEVDIAKAEWQGQTSMTPVYGLRKEQGQRILQTFAQLILHSKVPKVICHACLGIVSFCRGGEESKNQIEPSQIAPYLGDLLNAFAVGPLSLDVSSNIVLYMRAIASIACLADVAEKEFSPYFDKIVPGLMECVSYGLQRDTNGAVMMSGLSSYEAVSLRGAAIEAVSIVGKSMGTEENPFISDAKNLMTFIIGHLQHHDTNQEHLVMKDQLLAATARISSILGSAYIPFLSTVLQILINIAGEKTDVSVTDCTSESASDGTEFDEETGTESITMNLPGIGMKKLILNTTQIQEKSLAARVLYEHATALGPEFGPYVNNSFRAFFPLLQFKYSAEVRATTAQALGAIFDSACEYSSQAEEDQQMQLMDIYPRLLLELSAQLQKEEVDDIETFIAMSESISNICYSAFANTLKNGTNVAYLSNDEQVNTFTQYTITLIRDCLNRRQEINIILDKFENRNSQPDYLNMLAVETQVLTNLVDSIGYNIKTLKDKFVPAFSTLVCPFFGPLITTSVSNDPRALFAALCVFCDCVEHCGYEAAAQYGPLLCQGVMHGLDAMKNKGDIEVMEVSVYSTAQIARHCPSQTVNNNIPSSLVHQLKSIAKEGETNGKDDIQELRLVENSASALATLCLFSNSPYRQIVAAQRQDIMKTFLSNLPLREDEDEAKVNDDKCVPIISDRS